MRCTTDTVYCVAFSTWVLRALQTLDPSVYGPHSTAIKRIIPIVLCRCGEWGDKSLSVAAAHLQRRGGTVGILLFPTASVEPPCPLLPTTEQCESKSKQKGEL